MANRFLQIHPADNVLVALSDLKAGTVITMGEREIQLISDVPAKHKFAVHPILTGTEVRMYGIVVGKATEPIPQGGVITVSNTRHQAAPFTGKSRTFQWKGPDVGRWKNRTFMGYHRSDGQVGAANYWLVLPLVFCENRNVDVLKDSFEKALGFAQSNAYFHFVNDLVGYYEAGQTEKITSHPFGQGNSGRSRRVFENIDGIRFLTHQGGCGGTRQDADSLCALLAGYIHNPNVAGATVLSLGCQNAQSELLLKKLSALDPQHSKPVIILDQQREGEEVQLMESAIRKTFLGMVEANKLKRMPAPLSKLVVGLKCGGSDGFSGISANPAIGHTADLLAMLGGSTILCEFPELCGVEQELINRCVRDEDAERFIRLMRTYAREAEAVGSGFDMNPSPGNIKDGLITDAMKSAGAARKGGSSPVTDVLEYGQYVKRAGLNLLCSPGNDVESTTAMAGGGATIILFTTGLGTPTGNPVAQVVKISTNSILLRRMSGIIDIDTGPVIEGNKTVAEMGEEILEYIIALASGEKTTRAMDLKQDDFIPWKRGVSL